ncbi:hypothetical protein CLIT_10c01100 [Peptoclostridium litorale DSM 5388]|uniref:Uncharacterized protein n=1 Tax=Peptoclostridium litorale DSM 5388 TaxID=1121324 RepID=A0A069RF07_PEPLI|nr:hypothetical protein CLIT_23c02280 [Peptoclostridium litorale DSM 5388]KDR95383.1 hypothetical protein CLIT_10c01100 [Peptoclostridium litorale DSM 5388]
MKVIGILNGIFIITYYEIAEKGIKVVVEKFVSIEKLRR